MYEGVLSAYRGREAREERGVSVSQPAEPLGGVSGRSLRGLLVGALPGEAWVFSEWLRDVLPGGGELELIEVDGLDAALDAVRHETLELCLFGLNLGSAALLRFLRQSRVGARVLPVLVLAGRADEAAVVEALREGAQDFLLREELNRDSVRRVARTAARLGRALERERAAAERARQLELRFRSLAEAMTDGLLYFGSDGLLELCTPMASALIGASEPLEGRSIEEIAALFSDASGDPWMGTGFPATEAHVNGRPATVHGATPRGPSPVMALTLRARPVFAGDGDHPEVLLVINAEERPSLAGGLAVRTAGMAHDLANLLQAVQGGSDLLRRQLSEHESATARALAEQVESAARSAAVMVRRLSELSQERVHSTRPLRLDEAIGNARGWMQLLAGVDVRLDLHLQAPAAAITCDPDELHRILLNLIANAREAMPHGGRIRVATRTVPDTVVPGGVRAALEVSDSGSGMDAATRARAFQAEFSTKPNGHRGLGLATVRAIVERLGGRAELSSEEGQGTTVTVSLPVVS